MPKRLLEYQCLLISPSDVEDERNALVEATTDWNAQIGRFLGVRVDLVKWESHATPELGGSAQEILNEQIVDSCDLGVAVFWSRLGTPTDKHPSGSVEEIYRLRKKGAPVMVYFSKAPIQQDALTDDQFESLQQVKSQLQKDGLLDSYSNILDLKHKFTLHLTSHITNLLQSEEVEAERVAAAPEAVVSAPKPDVQVSMGVAFIVNPGFGVKKRVLAFSIRNLSPNPVFVSRLHFPVKDGGALLATQDDATGESLLNDRRLESGMSTSMHVDPNRLTEKVPLDQLEGAIITDAVGREYPIPDDEFAQAIQNLQDDA